MVDFVMEKVVPVTICLATLCLVLVIGLGINKAVHAVQGGPTQEAPPCSWAVVHTMDGQRTVVIHYVQHPWGLECMDRDGSRVDFPYTSVIKVGYQAVGSK